MVSEVAALKNVLANSSGFRYIELARWGYKLTSNWEIIATPLKQKAEFVAFPRCELDDVFQKVFQVSKIFQLFHVLGCYKFYWDVSWNNGELL